MSGPPRIKLPGVQARQADPPEPATEEFLTAALPLPTRGRPRAHSSSSKGSGPAHSAQSTHWGPSRQSCNSALTSCNDRPEQGTGVSLLIYKCRGRGPHSKSVAQRGQEATGGFLGLVGGFSKVHGWLGCGTGGRWPGGRRLQAGLDPFLPGPLLPAPSPPPAQPPLSNG